MLDLLDLIKQSQKSRQSQNQLSKQDQFNQIMLKLRQRNTHNDFFIKQYVKQTLRKKKKLLHIINFRKRSQLLIQCTQIQDCKSLISLKRGKLCKDAQLEVRSSFELKAKTTKNDVKQTHKTQDTIDDDGRLSNILPVMNFQLQEPKPNIKSKPLKYLKQSLDPNKHVKNSYCKDNTPIEYNNLSNLKQDNYLQSNRQSKNKISKSKMQLNIKTYIVGSQDVKFHKKIITEIIQMDQPSINESQRFKFLKKYEFCQELDENKYKKPLLPIIKHQGPKLNRNYFMSHIRSTGERITKDQPQILRLYEKKLITSIDISKVTRKFVIQNQQFIDKAQK